MAVKEVGRFVNTIHWQSDNSWQRELQRIKKYKKTVESAHEQIARTQYRASAGMIKAQQAQARAQEKIRKAALAAQMRSQKQLQALERRQAREQARHNKMMSGVVSGRSAAKQRTLTTMSGMKNMFSTATLNKYRASLQKLNAQYASGGMSVSMYNQKLAALRNEMRATEASARRLGSAFKSAMKSAGSKFSAGVDRAFTGAMMGTTAAAGLTNVAMQNSANRNSAYYGLMAQNEQDGKGNARQRTDDQMKFIKNTANKHGMDLASAETGYMQFAASTNDMSENDRRALFEAMAIKGRSVGASNDQMQRAQLALSQMAGLGKVQAEEKNQLAEAFAGSKADLQKAYARSIGKETVSLEEFNKAMKDGDVTLQKILPHLVDIWNSAQNTTGYAEGLKQPEIAMQRLKSAAYDASIAMFGQIDATDGVYTLAELINDTAQSLTDTLNNNKGSIQAVGEGLAAFFDQLMYRAGQAWAILKKGLEILGVDTSDPAAIGKALGDITAAIIGMKVIKELGLPALFSGIVTAFKLLKEGLLKLLPKGIREKFDKVKEAVKNPKKTITDTAKSAVEKGKGALQTIKEKGPELLKGAKNKLTNAIKPANLIKGGKAALRAAPGVGNVMLAAEVANSARNKYESRMEELRSGKDYSWMDPDNPAYKPAPTINTSQATPAPSTGFNGAVPSQVMVESSGDINAQFQVTVDENGLLRVVQKEVETAIGWEKTKETNLFASPNY
ncbi:TPA: tape measure protein [Escherichia coli]